MEKIQIFADKIGQYIMEKYIKPYLAGYVRFYRATVTAAAADGKITVQRPYDNPIALPYVGSAAGLAVGQQCVVLQFGSASNGVILGDGQLTNL